MKRFVRVLLPALLSIPAFSVSGTGGPGLFFREDWKETPAELPITQAHVANPELVLEVYGPGAYGIKKSNHPNVPNDPYYVWSGACPGNWAVALRHRSSDVNLTGGATVRWRARQSGFRQLRVILRLPGGTWLVSDQSDDESNDWRVREFRLREVRWRTLDMGRVSGGRPVDSPDLTRVEGIGFTDLMPGGSSDASSRLDWIEVHGERVARGPRSPE